MKINTGKILKTIIKIATFAYTSPATIHVSGRLYQDIPVENMIVKISGWILLEGLLLSGWTLLDNDKKANTALRTFYAALALAAYAGTLFVALANGEGWIGWIFRLAALLAIGFSIVQSGLINVQKRREKEAKNPADSWTVRMFDRRLSIREAKAKRKAKNKVFVAQLGINVEHVLDNLTPSEHAVNSIVVIDDRHMSNNADHNGRIVPPKVSSLAKLDTVWDDGRSKAHDASQDTKRANLSAVVSALRQGDMSKAALSRELCIPRSTLYGYLSELSDSGAIVADGSYKSGYRVNGKG